MSDEDRDEARASAHAGSRPYSDKAVTRMLFAAAVQIVKHMHNDVDVGFSIRTLVEEARSVVGEDLSSIREPMVKAMAAEHADALAMARASGRLGFVWSATSAALALCRCMDDFLDFDVRALDEEARLEWCRAAGVVPDSPVDARVWASRVGGETWAMDGVFGPLAAAQESADRVIAAEARRLQRLAAPPLLSWDSVRRIFGGAS